MEDNSVLGYVGQFSGRYAEEQRRGLTQKTDRLIESRRDDIHWSFTTREPYALVYIYQDQAREFPFPGGCV